MQQRKIIYLINPVSGTKGRSKLPYIIASATDAAAIDFEILPTVASGDYKFLAAKIMEENITDVVICGGDGSVNTIVPKLKHLPVRFGIVALGSGNGLAYTAGIPANTQKALQIIFKGHAKKIDAFTINNEFACMLCGLGFDAQVAHDFAKQKTRGLITYAKQSIKNYFTAKPFAFTIAANKKQFNTEAFFISIANSNQFGNNFTIAPQASLQDGLLDIVIVQKMNKALLPLAVLQQINSGRPATIKENKQGSIIYFQTSEMKITNHQLAPMHVDGEPKESMAALEIKIEKDSFNLLQP
jgi:diacylglycerol kinase (ATP)